VFLKVNLKFQFLFYLLIPIPTFFWPRIEDYIYFFSSLSWKLKWDLSGCLSSVCRHLSFYFWLLQNHYANFKETWHKSSGGEVSSNEVDPLSPSWDESKKLKRNTELKRKKKLLQNQQANFPTNFIQIWHTPSLGEGISISFLVHLTQSWKLKWAVLITRVVQWLERRVQRSNDPWVGGSNPTVGRWCQSFGWDRINRGPVSQ
jgi:hypothetical protein